MHWLKELDELKHRFSLDVVSTTADVKVSNCASCVEKYVLVLGSKIDGKLSENKQKFENRQVPVPRLLVFLTFILLPTPAC